MINSDVILKKKSIILKLALSTNLFIIITEKANRVITVLLQLSFGKRFMAKRSFLGQKLFKIYREKYRQ